MTRNPTTTAVAAAANMNRRNSVRTSVSAVREFVETNGGTRAIESVLIANNGIAAVKEIRSVRKWAYETFGDESLIKFTVMATPEDLSHNAEYIRMADHFIPVPGGSNNNNYKNVDLIVELAERTGVDAVWAGWGHASEDPRLPDRLHEKGIVFIGPPGNAMRALGDKISSTIVAQSAEVPCMGWSGNGITTDNRNADGYIDVPQDLYLKACVTNVEQAIEKADEVGYPLMIKASEGGGGKGIRKVTDPLDFRAAYAQVAAEVPGSPIFLMRLARGARHLEVQILADAYGNVISLFGRDCSVQRRHQKIIEEAPVTIAEPDVFEKMEMSAVRLAQLVGYVNAGTVEFLYDPESKEFYFLELNPRLQVEHPTTEIVSGVNIPAAQLQVAMGIPLHRIPHIRLLYGLQPHTTSDIDFHFSNPTSATIQRRPAPTGHVIACRITAENPDAGFKPSGGQLTELNFRSSTDVWGYFSVSANGGLHEFADSQFGHVFAYGHDRAAARRNMIMALKELRIRGDFRTTVEYLITLLETAEFTENAFSTEWLDARIQAKMTAERPDRWVSVITGATTAFLRSLEKGQVPTLATIKHTFPVSFILEGVRYDVRVVMAARDLLVLRLNGSHVVVRTRGLPDGGVLITYADKSHVVYAAEEVTGTRLTVNGKTVVLEEESDPTQLRSPSPGKLVRWLIPDGGHVAAGQAYAEIEVMKMIMPLVATDSGSFVGFRKQPGSPITAGELLGTLELDDMSQVKKATLCKEKFPTVTRVASTGLAGTKAHLRYLELHGILDQAIDGFEQVLSLPSLLAEYVEVMHKPELPYLHTLSVFSSFHGRLPNGFEPKLEDLLAQEPESAAFPAQQLLDILAEIPDQNLVQPLIDTVNLYKDGADAHTVAEITRLISRFMAGEALFAADGEHLHVEKTVLELRSRMDSEALYWTCFSRSRLGWKSQSLGHVLDTITKHRDILTSAANARDCSLLCTNWPISGGAVSQSIHLRARSLLIALQLPDFEERRVQLAGIVETLSNKAISPIDYPAANELLNSPFTIFDVLPAFFFSDTVSESQRLVALDMYVRRAYNTYKVHAVKHHTELAVPAVEWHFQFPTHDLGIGNARAVNHGLQGDLRTASVSDMTLMVKRGDIGPVRIGMMAAFTDVTEMQANLASIVKLFPQVPSQQLGRAQPWHVLNLAVQAPSQQDGNGAWPTASTTADAELSSMFAALLSSSKAALRARGIRRITIVVYRTGQYPRYFTYRERLDFAEDATIRHIEPSHAFQLELHRLAKFNLLPLATPTNRGVHVYHATGKDNALDSRFFVRALVRPGKLAPKAGYRDTVEYLTAEADDAPGTDCNHLFLNFLPELPVTPDEVQDSIAGFLTRHGKRMWKLRITSAEIRFLCLPTPDAETSSPSTAVTYRFYVSNVSGVLKAERYREVPDEPSGKVMLHTEFTTAVSGKGEHHLALADHVYLNKELVQPKRYRAHVMGTTYVYDYPDLFREALMRQWAHYPHVPRPAGPLVEAQELVLGEDGQLRKTPECPKGRQLVLIANDITYAIGSFGPQEDEVFAAASKYARDLGVPRIYVSANSGARIGLAEEVLAAYRIAWTDINDKAQGFKYLYLTPEDHERLRDSVTVERVEDESTGEVHMKLIDVIGIKDGLGVENLMGSGLIAGETSLAYDEIFTATLVACRSVGIGAYLVRLGQRAIQCDGQPIILTGAAALNKVLGRDVYTSNLQLGGVQIMHRNGVSHLTCVDPLHGVAQLVQWLSYVPAHKGASLPVLRAPLLSGSAVPPVMSTASGVLSAMSSTTGDRPASPARTEREYVFDEADRDSGTWVAGFFDRGSWMETMDGWSKTIVVGRGRLGGVPLGAIAVETRPVESVIPADPANPDSSEQTMIEPPGVWTPASAYKTAQAIRDLGREGLPLMIFANWRGFSGGQRDMYDAVLKFGSYIVDALREYPCPVFVYIVPHGELRGGAWVVLDPKIHQAGGMEMYADVTARGYRKPQVLATMDRLDAECRRWKSKLKPTDSATSLTGPNGGSGASGSNSSSDDDTVDLQARLTERQDKLYPVFHQAALKFADLHDTPGRMKAKGAIRAVVEWRSARRFFHWRIRRRVAEDRLRAKIARASPDLSRAEQVKLMHSWFALARPDAAWDDGTVASDIVVAQWLEAADEMQSDVGKSVQASIDALETAHLAALVAKILRDKPQAAVTGLAQALLGGGAGGQGGNAQMGAALASFAQLASVLRQ
ncbi:carboxyl transferase domain-domain-containing protein [Catenaria anguillulae PL171]|uniref:Carboxyl transferase domain-domain-containing protein n=1 Tax=Catenaria anguillulae PL171 TaxID=765915 RepID=A0A1Y2HUJ1_9FUNG|nr:carboxyl transferase domain-domain-containing protein [Catenaria anguillulae PL171]